MSKNNFIFKEKTEKYKEFIIEPEHGQSDEITTEETIILLHLCTIKTPTLSAVMSEQGVADCAFQMHNGVNDDTEIIVSFTFNLFYLFDGYNILRHNNFKINCNEELKPFVENFIEINYFDKDIFNKLWD